MQGRAIKSIAQNLQDNMPEGTDVVLGGSTASALHAQAAGEGYHRPTGDLDFVAKPRGQGPGATDAFVRSIEETGKKGNVQRILKTDVKTPGNGKPVGASFKAATEGGTVGTREYPVDVNGSIERLEVSVKDSTKPQMRMTKIDGVRVPTKQELIDTRRSHTPRPHKAANDKADLETLLRLEQRGAERGRAMLSETPVAEVSNLERATSRVEGLERSHSHAAQCVGQPASSGDAAGILREMLPAQAPPAPAPPAPAPPAPPAETQAPPLAAVPPVSVPSLVRMMREEGRAPRLPAVAEDSHAGEEASENGPGSSGAAGAGEASEEQRDGCTCGRPMRPVWNGVCNQLVETCVCGQGGPSVVNLSGNVHGFSNL